MLHSSFPNTTCRVHFKRQYGLLLMIKWSAGTAILSFFVRALLKAKVNAVIERPLMHSHVKWHCEESPEGAKALNEFESLCACVCMSLCACPWVCVCVCVHEFVCVCVRACRERERSNITDPQISFSFWFNWNSSQYVLKALFFVASPFRQCFQSSMMTDCELPDILHHPSPMEGFVPLRASPGGLTNSRHVASPGGLTNSRHVWWTAGKHLLSLALLGEGK